jgi:sister-chromatid-cohesion protein PDS5
MFLYSQTLHAICDLGFLIAKRLCNDQTNLSEAQTVPLPVQLYMPLPDNQNKNSVVCAPIKHEIIA